MSFQLSVRHRLAFGSACLVWGLAAACSSSGDTAASDAGSTTGTGGGGNDAAGYSEVAVGGGFTVQLKPATDSVPAYTDVGGKVSDGPTPSTVIWDLVEEGAGCKLTKPRAPFCNPACGSGKLCIADNRCAADPMGLDLGPVQVSGLGADFALTATGNIYHPPGDLSLPSPPAPEGSDVKVSVSGGPFGAFAISSRVVAPLVSSGELTLQEDKPLQLSWMAPGQADLARIAVKVDISHHGGTKGLINCDVADTGSLELPTSQVSKLIHLGVGGFPHVVITRIATGSAAIAAGKVELNVISEVTREAKVAGFDSCNEELPCPSGRTCQSNNVCTP